MGHKRTKYDAYPLFFSPTGSTPSTGVAFGPPIDCRIHCTKWVCGKRE
jgi:hypothetical protein